MDIRSGVEAQKFNVDMEPDRAIVVASYPALEPLLCQERLTETFGRYEKAAKFAKKAFQYLGTATLASLVAVLLLAAVRLYIAPLVLSGSPLGEVDPRWSLVNRINECLSVLAVALVILSLALRMEKRWLITRFWAELLRHWKFNKLLDGALLDQVAADPAQFKERLDDELSQFLSETSKGYGLVLGFLKDESIFPRNQDPPRDPAVLQQVLAAYQRYRYDWQMNHFRVMADRLDQRNQSFEAALRGLFFLACLLAVLEPVFGLLHQPVVLLTVSLAVVVVMIVSVAARVFRSANALVENKERYQMISDNLASKHREFTAASLPAKKWVLLKEMEEVLLGETRDFVRVVQKSSFLL